jgi:trehalose 6-phosphate synthase
MALPAVPFVLASNRGPVSFAIGEDDELVARRGSGGLVSGLAPLVEGTGTPWVAAAMSAADRAAAARGLLDTDDMTVRLLDIDPDVYRMAYDVVGNQTLWYLYHGLFDLARRPRFDAHFRAAWEAYREVNDLFANAIAEVTPDGGVALVQDFHLALVAPRLRALRPDVPIVHFSHTPFARPDEMRVLPDAMASELLEGMGAATACGFHCQRWADAFVASSRELVGGAPTTFVSPLASDPEDLAATVISPACGHALDQLDQLLGDRAFLVRVDRIELSKNILRGFAAYDDLLDRYPQWRERVVFGAFIYPSRQGLADYLAYRQEVETVVRGINERWATPGWTPIVADFQDDYPRSVAALRRFDVLLVNPVRDGLNLVATEGALANERNGLVLLSPEAGAWAALEGAVRPVHPYDIVAAADALADALATPADQRAAEAAVLRQRARSRTPADWLAEQLAMARR